MPHAPAAKQPRSDPDLDRSLLDFMDGLAAVASGEIDLKPTLDWVANDLKERLRCDEVCVRFTDPERPPNPSVTYVAKRTPGIGSWPAGLATSVAGLVVRDRQALRTRDLLDDPRFPGLRGTGGSVRAALVVPLVAESAPIGVLAATESRPGREWSDADERMLAKIAEHCGTVIERVRLRETRVELERLRQRQAAMTRENRYAGEIQRNMLPAGPLELGGWRVAGQLIPAAEVGGDGYDFRRIGDSRMCVTISDVEGKGIPAAVLAVSMQMLLREVFGGEWSLEAAQRHLCRDVAEAHSGRLVTLVAADLDVASGMLRYVRAGHPYPLVRRRDGRVEPLTAGGLPLGICADAPMEFGHVLLAPGDAVLLYTDGVSEALDGGGRMFGEGVLESCWREAGARPPEEAVKHVVRTVLEYRAQARREHDDDVAVVVLAAPRG
jgi:serine phosphatase RsbU (regulator of sigma subunit)